MNAGFLQVVSRTEVNLRVYERGAGETLACGTGACAAVVAGIRRGLLDSPDAALRASLAASQISGMLITRYVLKLPGIATASVDELVQRVGPTIQHYLTD